MKVADLFLWDMKPEPTEGCEIQCPDCGEWSSHNDWSESEVYCEDCGEHAAIRCPKCKEDFDNVWSKTFIVKNQ